MSERKENTGFSTLEEMRDGLANFTKNKDKKEKSSFSAVEIFAKKGVDEENNKEKKYLLNENNQDTLEFKKVKLESVNLNEEKASLEVKDSNDEALQELSDAEKKRASQKKLEEFLNGGKGNIYSNLNRGDNPSLFQTSVFENASKITAENAKDFKYAETISTQVGIQQKLKEQRNKKTGEFKLRWEEKTQSKVRPLYADAPDEKSEKSDELIIDNIGKEREPDELEYRSKKDRQEVLDYLKKFKADSLVSVIGMGILAAISLVWICLLFFAPTYIPAVFTPSSGIIYLTIWVIFIGVSLSLSHDILQNGLKGIISFKANCDTPVSLAVAVSLLQLLIFYFSGSRMVFDQNVFIMAPVAIECLFFHNIGRYLLARRAKSQFCYLTRKGARIYAASILDGEELAEAFTRGRVNDRPYVGVNRKTDFMSDFMYYTFLEDFADKIGYFAAPIGFCFSILSFVFSLFFTNDFWLSFTIFAAALVIIGFSSTIVGVQTPIFLSRDSLNGVGAGALSYEAAAEFGSLNAIITSAQKLFPKGTVEFCGMRMFNGFPIDKSIINATSILRSSNSILSDMFMEILLWRTDILKPVDSVLFEDGLGVSGWADNLHITIGNREMMINHNVSVPSVEEEKKLCSQGADIIYVSISGELAAAFIFKLSVDLEIKEIIDNLLENNMVLVVQTVDSVITAEKLSDVYQIDEEMFKILPAKFHKAYRKQTEPIEKFGSPIFNNGSLKSFVLSLICAKKLKKTVLVNMGMAISAAAIGVVLVLLFGITKQLQFFSALPIFLLMAIVNALIFAISSIRKF